MNSLCTWELEEKTEAIFHMSTFFQDIWKNNKRISGQIILENFYFFARITHASHSHSSIHLMSFMAICGLWRELLLLIIIILEVASWRKRELIARNSGRDCGKKEVFFLHHPILAPWMAHSNCSVFWRLRKFKIIKWKINIRLKLNYKIKKEIRQKCQKIW